jgi:molybdate transport system substrate-binding protein
MSKMGSRLVAAILALLAGLCAEAAASAEIKVMCSGAMRGVMQQLGPDFQKSSGHQLVIEYATAEKVEEKIAADEVVDVAILTKPRAEKLVRAAKLALNIALR